jgi:hypothetical protein
VFFLFRALRWTLNLRTYLLNFFGCHTPQPDADDDSTTYRVVHDEPKKIITIKDNNSFFITDLINVFYDFVIVFLSN